MNTTTPQKVKVGYELRINYTGLSGKDNWTRVGFVFSSKYEAEEYRAKKHPRITKYTIMGIRLRAPVKPQQKYMSTFDSKK